MNMKLMQQARAIIADEIIGCDFPLEDKEGAKERAEGILIALEQAGLVLAIGDAN